jgi:hypothetical protein
MQNPIIKVRMLTRSGCKRFLSNRFQFVIDPLHLYDGRWWCTTPVWWKVMVHYTCMLEGDGALHLYGGRWWCTTPVWWKVMVHYTCMVEGDGALHLHDGRWWCTTPVWWKVMVHYTCMMEELHDLKRAILWNVTPCYLIEIAQRFLGKY